MRRHILFTVFIIICNCVVFADESNDTVVVRRLDNVEVSAAPAARGMTSTAPLHSLDSEKLRITGVSDIADAMHRLPGITLRDYGGAGGLKTVSVRGFGASHTGVVYDGLPLNDSQSGQIDVSRYSLDNVGSLTMVIGDNDDIFVPARVAASAASLFIRTMPAKVDSLGLTAQFRTGSWEYYNPFFRIALPVGGKVSVSAIGEYIHADNDYPFTFFNGDTYTRERRNNSLMNSGHGEINVVYTPDSRSSFSAKAYYYDNARRLPGPIIYYNNVCHERLRETNAFAQLNYRRVLNSEWVVQGSGKFNFSRSLYHDEDGKYPGGELNQNYWQREAYATGSVMWLPAEAWALDYSVDYSYNNLTSNLVDDIRPYRNSLLQSLTARWRTGRITAMARALYSVYLNGAKDGESAKDASRLSPSLSVSVRPFDAENLFVRFSYKNIFRVPTFNEAYFDHYGSVDLLPETTDQLNLGFTWNPQPHSWLTSASFTLDGYMNHVNDMIVGIPYNMFVWQMVNLGKVRVFGVDFTCNLSVRLAHRQSLYFAANYSYQRAQPRTSPDASDWMKQVAYIPMNSGSLSLTYENPLVNVVWHTTAVGARYATNNNLPATRIAGYAESGIAAWHVFNLRKGHTIELRGDLLNLFDKQYEVVARYPMPGRSWQLTVKFQL